MVCVARWFCRQEGASSCPCCRRESGAYDDVPRAEGEEDSDSEWEDGDEDGDGDGATVISVEFYWQRDANGVWKEGLRETTTTNIWNPATEPAAVPEEITEGAVALQRIWRGYWVRHRLPMQDAAEALLALKAGVVVATTSFA